MDSLLNLGINPMSILVYMANIGLLVGVLTFFLHKPLLKFLDERRQTIADSLEQARVLKEELDSQLKLAHEEKIQLEKELREELANLHKFVETKRAELLLEMEQEKNVLLAKAHKEIEAKKDALVKEAEKQVMDLMVRIVLDIVQNKVPEKVIQESVQDSWKHYRNH